MCQTETKWFLTIGVLSFLSYRWGGHSPEGLGNLPSFAEIVNSRAGLWAVHPYSEPLTHWCSPLVEYEDHLGRFFFYTHVKTPPSGIKFECLRWGCSICVFAKLLGSSHILSRNQGWEHLPYAIRPLLPVITPSLTTVGNVSIGHLRQREVLRERHEDVH